MNEPTAEGLVVTAHATLGELSKYLSDTAVESHDDTKRALIAAQVHVESAWRAMSLAVQAIND